MRGKSPSSVSPLATTASMGLCPASPDYQDAHPSEGQGVSGSYQAPSTLPSGRMDSAASGAPPLVVLLLLPPPLRVPTPRLAPAEVPPPGPPPPVLDRMASPEAVALAAAAEWDDEDMCSPVGSLRGELLRQVTPCTAPHLHTGRAPCSPH